MRKFLYTTLVAFPCMATQVFADEPCRLSVQGNICPVKAPPPLPPEPPAIDVVHEVRSIRDVLVAILQTEQQRLALEVQQAALTNAARGLP